MADERAIPEIITRINRLISKITSSFHTVNGKYPKSDPLRRLRDAIDRLEAAIQSAGQICKNPPALNYLPRAGLASALEDTYKQLGAQLHPSFKKICQRLTQCVLPSTLHTKELDEIIQCITQSARLVSFHAQLIFNFASVRAGAEPLSRKRLVLSEVQEYIIARLRDHQITAVETQVDARHPICLPGTQKCALEDIYSWICSPNASSIYWHVGIAGSGKSTLSRTIACVLHRTEQLGGSFFFDKTKRQSRGTQGFCASLAAQLALYQPATASHICETMKADPELFTRSLSVQFCRLITGCISKAFEMTDDRNPIFIIIGSLDQLDQGDAELLLNLFSRSVRQCPALKLIITSSPGFQDSVDFEVKQGMICSRNSSEESENSHKHDVSLYVDYASETMGRRYRESVADMQETPPDWPGDLYMETIKNISATNYTVATVLLRYIWDQDLSNPTDRLQKFLAIEQMRLQFPSRSILQSILDGSPRGLLDASLGVSCEDRRLILGSIAILQDPLPTTAFASLLDVSSPVALEALTGYQSACGVALSTESIVAFVPQVYELFCGSTSDISKPHLLNVQVWQGRMFTNCLRVLSQSLRSRPNTNTSDRSLQSSEWIPRCEEPLTNVSYACMYWGHHLEKSESLLENGGMVEDFLKSYLFEWTAELCLMALPFESLRILMSLRRTIPPFSNHQIKSSLENAIRLLVPWIDKTQSLTEHESPKSLVQVQQHGHDSSQICTEHFEGVPIVSELRSMDPGKQVHAVAVSPDSQVVACGTAEKLIQLWSIHTGTLMQTLKGHRRSVSCLAFSSDGRLASGSYDHTVKIWRPDIGVSERTLRSHSDIVGSVTYSYGCKLIASSSDDKTVKLWSVDQGTLLHTFEYSSYVYTVSFTPDSTYLVSGSADNAIRIWDVLSGNMVTILEGHNGGVPSTTIHRLGNLIASGSEDTTVRIWSLDKGHIIATITSHSSPVISVEFLPEGNRLASASANGTIQIHSVATMDILYANRGHEDAVNSISLIPDLGFMVSGSTDKTLKLWIIASERRQQGPRDIETLPTPSLLSGNLAEISLRETHAADAWLQKADIIPSRFQHEDISPSSSESSLDLVELSEMSLGQRKAYLASKRRNFGYLDMAGIDPRSKIGSAMLNVDMTVRKDSMTVIDEIFVQLSDLDRCPDGRAVGEIRNVFDLWFVWLDYIKHPAHRTRDYPRGLKEVKVADLLLEWWHYEETVQTHSLMDFFKRKAVDEICVLPTLPMSSYRAIMFGLWRLEMTRSQQLDNGVDLGTVRQHAAWISGAQRLAMATLPMNEIIMSESTGSFRVKDPWMQISLDPCPWLQQWWVGARSNAHFLWDTQARMTVENDSNSTDYLVVSHTWGRWRMEGDGANVEGVPWLVPRNSLFDVTLLPDILSRFPFESRYIWFDLVCIPQYASALQQQEISKQADIFQNAKWAAIWFNRIDSWEGIRAAINWLGREYLLTCPEVPATRHHLEDDDLDLLADQATGLANMVQKKSDPFGYNFMHHGKLKKVAPDPWFTSLWTLQEICLRPDMFLCNSNMEALTISSRNLRAVPMDHIISLLNALQGGAIMRKSLPLAIHELAGVMALTSVSQVLDMSPIALLGHGSQRHCQDINRAPAIMSALGTTEWYRAFQQKSQQSSPSTLEMIYRKYPLQFVREAFACFGAVFFTSNQHGSNKLMTSSQAYSYDLGWRRITDVKFRATMMPFTPDNTERSSIMVLPHFSMGITEHATVKKWIIHSDGSVHMRKAGILAACPRDPNRRAVIADVWAWIPTSKFGGAPRKVSQKDVDLNEWLASFRPKAEKYAIWLFQAGQYSTGILLERLYKRSDSREFFKFGTFSIPQTTESHRPQLERVDLQVI